ncbi:hypothetical protein ACJW30_06G208000 [Castanea mollissima]
MASSRKMEIPYCIVKGKSCLGSIVHKKTTSILCLTSVKNEDKLEFSKILETIKIKHLVTVAIVLKGLGVLLFIFGISLGAKQGSN